MGAKQTDGIPQCGVQKRREPARSRTIRHFRRFGVRRLVRRRRRAGHHAMTRCPPGAIDRAGLVRQPMDSTSAGPAAGCVSGARGIHNRPRECGPWAEVFDGTAESGGDGLHRVACGGGGHPGGGGTGRSGPSGGGTGGSATKSRFFCGWRNTALVRFFTTETTHFFQKEKQKTARTSNGVILGHLGWMRAILVELRWAELADFIVGHMENRTDGS